ncbi:MAG: error-prone DNA polymerase [Pirellulaceae bacterium]|jgi:error-prone DNA polymerase|nr:error-prone DNA polymerase [Pirellulaceae bacterium]MDP6553055.1 error-prone DNA polymerase [Pirellulaceae bacterium]
MPEAPDLPKRRPQQARPQQARTRHGVLPYAELHCRTNFTFLEGASHSDELVTRAVELGYTALAITDRNSLAGIVRAYAAAKESGLKLLYGAEITPTDGPPVVLLATDRAAYGRLSRLLTLGRRRTTKGACELNVADIAEHHQGLLAMVVPAHQNDPYRQPAERASAVHTYRDIFGDCCYLLGELHYGTADRRRLDDLLQLSNTTDVPLVAAGDVHYHIPARMPLQHVLTAIRHGTTVAELGQRLLPNAERHLRTLAEVQAVFARIPQAIRRTLEVADRCTFSLDELRYEYPRELSPPGETPLEYLRRLAWQGARQRYGQIPDKVVAQLDHELQLIHDLRYEAFFLTVYDLVCFARSRDILCQGRGSAANSTVCYCLGVTAVDPMESNLLFERFVSRERDEAPDIDVDFEHQRREEVLQYIYQKYGRHRAGIAATVITYRPRSAVRDVGKALGLSLDRVDALAKNTDWRSNQAVSAERCLQSGIDPGSRLGRQLSALVDQLLGFPRHLSQHVGGMVITQGPLCEMVPIENAAMPDRTVIQWDKDDLETLGILKVDCLCLGMLTAIHKCFDLLQQHTGQQITIASIPHDDPAVYDMMGQADTIGVFQIESRAQMSMLPRLRPRRFYDLVIEVAIVRPGPIQGNMVHPYLRRRCGEEEATYPNDDIRKVLERTLGVPLFQEQAMQLAVVAAGFTPGEADQLRRAMGAWRRPGLIDNFRKKLIEGMLARGHSQDFADRLFEQIRGFGEYGFPESHAASFAILSYVSAWLKHHHPAAFTVALLNSQPMGFYAPAQLIRDVQNHGVEILPIDVNHSDWDCTLEPTPTDNSVSPRLDLRLGMRLVQGLRHTAAQTLVRARQVGRFRSMAELTTRSGLGQTTMQRLAAADAFASLDLDRRSALWQALDQTQKPQDQPLLASLTSEDSPTPRLPRLTEQEEVFADYRAAGLSLRQHPLAFCREKLSSLGVVTADQLVVAPANRCISVAGLVLMRQRPSTAKGITFVTLEDETGTANLVVRQKIWDRFDQIARRASAMIAHGKLERKNEVIHVVVVQLEDMSDRLASIGHRSRDFR